jgi:hypothetical protein
VWIKNLPTPSKLESGVITKSVSFKLVKVPSKASSK